MVGDPPRLIARPVAKDRPEGRGLGNFERIERGEIDPSFIITHRIGLEDAPTMYRTFRDKDDSCIKVVMKPGGGAVGMPYQGDL